eukprot:3197537-Karenia_brevis.AAC.1
MNSTKVRAGGTGARSLLELHKGAVRTPLAVASCRALPADIDPQARSEECANSVLSGRLL